MTGLGARRIRNPHSVRCNGAWRIRPPHSALRNGILCVLLLTVASTARAALVSWIADADGFWDEPSSWSTGNVPQAGDDVVIDRPGVSITVTFRNGTV